MIQREMQMQKALKDSILDLGDVSFVVVDKSGADMERTERPATD
jgi:hypothetical protein